MSDPLSLERAILPPEDFEKLIQHLDRADAALNPTRELCARCGQVAHGRASINGTSYCHPSNPDRPDCYHIVTVFGGSEADQ